MAATAQAQAEATKAAQRARIEHAKAQGERVPGAEAELHARPARRPCASHVGPGAVGNARIAQETGLTRQTVYRIKG